MFRIRSVFSHSILVTSVALPAAFSQVVISEIMFNAPEQEYYEEFIELYNGSAVETIDLSGYRIGDQLEQDSLVSAGSGLLLQPGRFALVLDPGYWEHSTIYDSSIPPQALILTIDDNAFGAYGLRNDPADTIVFADPFGVIITSYTYTPDNPDGISEEKIRLDGGDNPSNWTNCLNYLGTPGFINSVNPPNVDIELVTLSADPSPLPYGTPLLITAVLGNLGQSPVETGEIVFAMGSVVDFAPDSILGATYLPVIQPLDSAEVHLTLDSLPPGPHRLLAWHTLIDDHPDNDTSSALLLCGYPGGSLIINEIFPAPEAEQSEWIELYNPHDTQVDLFGFLFSDADTNDKSVIIDTTLPLEQDEFLLLAEDSAVFDLSLPQEVAVIILSSAWPALNNDGDTPTLFDAAGSLQDAVPYSGSAVLYGISLERIYIDGPSDDPNNWQASHDPSGATPGRTNSYGTQTEPHAASGSIKITPDPYDPDRHESMEIEITMPPDAAAVTVLAFDLRGRRLKTIFDGAFPPYPILWDGRDQDQRRLIPGLYIMFVEFRDTAGDRREVIKETFVIAGKL